MSSVASDHNAIKAKVKWVLKNNKMVKSDKSRKLLSYLKNSECTKEVTQHVLEKYSNSCTSDHKHNYTLFSRLAKEAIGQFVPDKEAVKKT